MIIASAIAIILAFVAMLGLSPRRRQGRGSPPGDVPYGYDPPRHHDETSGAVGSDYADPPPHHGHADSAASDHFDFGGGDFGGGGASGDWSDGGGHS